jgi:hypothetical protein
MGIFDPDGKAIAPDVLAARGMCPETGIDLNGVDMETHIRNLWPGARSTEAERRIELIRAYRRRVDALHAEREAKRVAAEEAAAKAGGPTANQ